MPHRVLLVEDNQELCNVTEAILHGVAGYDVQRAQSISEALASFVDAPPDLVLLDLVMPDMAGWRFVEFPHVYASTVPIVVVSGLAKAAPGPHLRRRLSGYLVKPFEVPKLISGCAHVLKTDRSVPNE